MSRTSQQRCDQREKAALDIAREALRQIARSRASAWPTAFYTAKARFALDRIDEVLREAPP